MRLDHPAPPPADALTDAAAVPQHQRERLTPARIAHQVERAARQGAAPAELAAVTRELVAQLVEQDRADERERRKARRDRRPDRGAGGVAGQLRRCLRALDRRVTDDPTGVADTLRDVDDEVEQLRDRTAAALRTWRPSDDDDDQPFTWPQVAQLLGVSRMTAIRRWGPKPEAEAR